MSEPVHVFWCEPTGRIRRFLRCYQPRDEPKSEYVGQSLTERSDQKLRCATWCCNAMKRLDEIPEERSPDGYQVTYDAGRFPWDAFPTVCEDCGLEMDAPKRQIFIDSVYVVKTGERAGQEFARRDLPTGAMWDATWYHDWPRMLGRDGIALMVMTQDGEWHVDGRANNCTKPDDEGHKCWVRRGDPREGYCHVDKDASIQETCEAGAGSIWMRSPNGWHGFLYRGYLCDADGGQAAVDRLLEASSPRRLPVAERVLSVVTIDTVPKPIVVRPAAPARTGWRSNRGFQRRPRR